MSQSFKVELTLDQVNLILSTLAERPYKQVAPVIFSIEGQCNAQQEAAEQAEAARKAEDERRRQEAEKRLADARDRKPRRR